MLQAGAGDQERRRDFHARVQQVCRLVVEFLRVQASADGHLQGTPLFAVLTESFLSYSFYSIRMTEQVDTTNGLKLTQTGGNVVCGNGADKTCLDVCALPACRSTPVHTQRPHAHTRVLSQSLPHSNAHFLPHSLTHSHSHRWYSRARLCLPLRKSATPASSTRILPAPTQYARNTHTCVASPRE